MIRREQGGVCSVTMRVNRPLLFLIRHRLTSLLLFGAKVCDPGTA